MFSIKKIKNKKIFLVYFWNICCMYF
jgi:hypothetical protein